MTDWDVYGLGCVTCDAGWVYCDATPSGKNWACGGLVNCEGVASGRCGPVLACSACGFSLLQSSFAGPSWSGIGSEAKQPVVKNPINFQEFLKRKAESRKEHFKFKPKSAKKVEKDVSINIGNMRYVNGTLKFCRGRNLPVTVPSSASKDDIFTGCAFFF